MPNPYFGTITAFIFFILTLVKRFKLYVKPELKKIIICWVLILFFPVISFFIFYSNLNNLFWYLFTTSPILIFPFVLYNVKMKLLIANLIKFTQIELLLFTIQYILLVFKYRNINPFVSDISAGDLLSGTSIGFSSLMAVTMSLICLFFMDLYLLTKNKIYLLYGTMCFLMMVLTGYMAGITLFFTSTLVFFFFSLIFDFVKFKINKIKLGIVFSVFISVIVIAIQMQSNFIYTTNVLVRIFSASPPLKIQSFIVTFSDFIKENPGAIISGIGGGNYCSRAAFITGGQYLQPSNPWYIPITPSKYYIRYMYPLFEKRLKFKTIGNVSSQSMINTPFSQYQTIFAEGGVLSLIVLIILIILCFKIYFLNNRKLYAIAILYTFSLLIIDNWLEFPNYSILFWIIICNQRYKMTKDNYKRVRPINEK